MSRSLRESLRIACLLPSATEICIALGLADKIVGVTHECNIENVLALSNGKRDDAIRILTNDGLSVTEQGDIHKAVSEQSQKSCLKDSLPTSLYPIVPSEWKKAVPTVVLTQDLCSVCAPTTEDVRRLMTTDEDETMDAIIVSLKPTMLNEVADTFVTVAAACGVPERGTELRDKFLDDLSKLNVAIESHRAKDQPKPSLVLLEWLDPPMDAGHWIPDMMQIAGVRQALPKVIKKSHLISWTSIDDADPDVIVVACCGFDLERNMRDAQKARSHLSMLSSYAKNSIYAADGNTYFACPGPGLVGGTVILARCAYENQPKVLQAIDELSLSLTSVSRTTEGWQRVSFEDNGLNDPEDCVTEDFCAAHERACASGDFTYVDPESGYSVFTELAHKKRGLCCGSGCRHCPFSHENVKDKSSRIQQPALLHKGTSKLFSVADNDKFKVLFFSGGKDSFLAIRALVKQYKESPFGLVLLTTFDAQSRSIAHQDIHIDDVLRQAKHLDITLLGIPMHRTSREPYLDRILRGLDVMKSQCNSKLSALVFGDLHLAQIKGWRDEEIGKIGVDLEYPLWKVPYLDLMDDLEKSLVTFKISATTKAKLNVGTVYCRQFFDEIQKEGVDGFGENGEFHTIAQVWDTDRNIALGL